MKRWQAENLLAASSICGSRDHQHGRRLYGHGIQSDRRRLRADRAAFLWSVNRTDQYFLQKVSPVILSGCQFFMGGVLLFIVGILMGGHLDHMSIAGVVLILYLAMVSAVAYTLWSVLLAHNEVSKVAIFGFVNPLCSVVLSALVLGEVSQAFNARSLIALILVCVGIYIVNCKSKK